MARKTTLQPEAKSIDVNSFISDAPLQEKKSVLKERKNKVISITLRQSDLSSIDDFCAETGMSRSNLIRLATQDYIDKYHKK